MPLKFLRKLCSHKPWTPTSSLFCPFPILPLALHQRLPALRRRGWLVPHGRVPRWPPLPGHILPCPMVLGHFSPFCCPSNHSPHPTLASQPQSVAGWVESLISSMHSPSGQASLANLSGSPDPWPWSLWVPLPRAPDPPNRAEQTPGGMYRLSEETLKITWMASPLLKPRDRVSALGPGALFFPETTPAYSCLPEPPKHRISLFCFLWGKNFTLTLGPSRLVR